MEAEQYMRQSQDAAPGIKRALGLTAQYKHWVTSNLHRQSIWSELIEAEVFEQSAIRYTKNDFHDFERVCFAVAIIGANENKNTLISTLQSINVAVTENRLF